MRRIAAPLAVPLLVAALLAPVAGAGAGLCDALRDMAGPTDNPETPGPDVYGVTNWDDGIPDLPDPAALDVPLAEAVDSPGVPLAAAVPEEAPPPPRTTHERPLASRGPPTV